VLLEAFAAVLGAHPEARLILVPHEPTAAHLAGVETLAARLGLGRPVRLSEGTEGAPFILVDRVGVLARLYGAGAMAYVGGGFGRAGLHSVLEPAAWARPVVFGPWWTSSREAGLLREAGAGLALPPRSHGAAGRLGAIWRSWLTNETARREAGERASLVVKAGLGAAERNAELVERLIGASPGSTPGSGLRG
jgi:3-deoxy-D-manno-octulosonic-acid transferase